MTRITVRFPDETYKKLKEAKERKPHMSLNTFIIETLEKALSDKAAILAGKTQIDMEAL